MLWGAKWGAGRRSPYNPRMHEVLFGDEPMGGDFLLRQFQVGYPWQIGLRTRHVYRDDIWAMTRGNEFEQVRDLLDPWLFGKRTEAAFDLPTLSIAGARLTVRGFGEASLSFSITNGSGPHLVGWFGGDSTEGADGREAQKQKAMRHAAKTCKSLYGKESEMAMLEVGALDQAALTMCSPEDTAPWQHQVEALLLAILETLRLDDLRAASAAKPSKKKSKR